MRITRPQALTAALAISTLTLASCGAGDTAPAEEAGTEETGNSDASLAVGFAAVPANLDFTSTGGAAIFEALLYNTYEGLVRLGDDGTIEPLLAESWDISEDGLEYTFDLQEGVTFHDGSEFTAENVEFSLERLDEWTANAPENLEALESVEVVDEHTVTLHLSEPDYDVLFWLTGPEGAMFDPDSVDDLATEANGTGPFVFESYENAVEMSFSRNADYWGEQPDVAELSLLYYDDANSAANALRTGGVDALVRAEAYDQVDSFEDDEFTVQLGDSQGVVVVTLNSDSEGLSEVEVRQAISMAIDKESVLAASTSGYGTELGAPSVPTDPYYEDFSGTYAYDPEAAEQALEDAGYDDLSLTFTIPNRPYAEAAAQVIQDNLSDIGVEVTIESQEFPAVWIEESMTDRNFDLTVVNHVENRNMVNYGNPDHYWGYDSEEVREHFDDAESATDDDEHSAAMLAATEQIVEDVPGIWLYNPPNIVISRTGVDGLPQNDLGAGFDFSGVTVTE
ncbi:ABC transporter substrate-binding protein [Nesterenkonia salmonea]|uniref:ABC transporter substrate-binding protein n=1 Tax=Nesterenkonia salmonea TaxID=1804987 RepID=A0A5R9BKH6_9MICC|nr:ABC transporter substrate-binding protein [Nesterenkonia salmonea]TLQ01109.1 ABC transporter substrate-binding protein [Nesterenkonia salmonea]